MPIMTKVAEQVLAQALQLDPSDRAELRDRLFELDDDGPPEPGYEEAWTAELDERLGQIERGEVTLIPWEQVRDLLGRDSDDSNAAR